MHDIQATACFLHDRHPSLCVLESVLSDVETHAEPETASTVSFTLADGGEMGARMRAMDWSATALGPPETWPRSLHSILYVMLASRHPMFLWWGPELIQFCNDAYLPSLGTDRHMTALGARGKEFWSEIWPIIGSEIESVMRGGESTWHVDHLVPIARNGRLEEVYWTYSYSPVLDDDGCIGGTLVTVQETTARVLTERRMETLRLLAGRTTTEARTVADVYRIAADVLAQNDADIAFALLYLGDDDGDKLRLMSRTGMLPPHLCPDIVEINRLELDEPGWPLAHVARSGRAELLENVRSRFGDLPGGRWPEPVDCAIVLPIASAGRDQPPGVLVVGISPRIWFDEHYRGFLDLAASQTSSAITNARADEAERATTKHEVTEQVRARQQLEADIAERERAESLLAGQRDVLEMIAQGAPLAETLAALAHFIEAQTDGLLCSILLLDRDGQHLRHGAAPSLPDEFNRAIDGVAIGPAVGSCGTAAYRAEPVVVADIAADPLWADFRDLALPHGLRACWSTPILSPDSHVLGTFAIYHREPRSPGPRERELVDVLTYLAGIAIERHRAESEHGELLEREQAARAEAEQERARLRMLFEQAPAAIAVLRGPEHVYQLANQHYAAIFGHQRAYVGRPVREVFADVARPDIWELLDRVYQSGEPYVGTEWLVELDRHGDGKIEGLSYHFVCQPLRDMLGGVEGIFIHAVDVTDQVRARQEVEAAVQARDEFLSIAAHELRTPVTSIKGVAQLLQRMMARGTLDDTRLERNLGSIVSQADRLGGLVVDLLDVSRVRGGQLALRPREMDLAALVQKAVASCRDAIENQRHIITVEGASEPCQMIGDPDRLEQILSNLLDNAVKYSPDGGEIAVRLWHDAETVSIDVADRGIGLAEGMPARIFEPFGRAANATEQNIPGMGLGLYISRQIAERHAGMLSAESDGEEHGTTFRLHLPRWSEPDLD